MTDRNTMPVQIQRRGRPETRQTVIVAMEFNLAHMLDQGWEFPLYDGHETHFGSVYERQKDAPEAGVIAR